MLALAMRSGVGAQIGASSVDWGIIELRIHHGGTEGTETTTAFSSCPPCLRGESHPRRRESHPCRGESHPRRGESHAGPCEACRRTHPEPHDVGGLNCAC